MDDGLHRDFPRSGGNQSSKMNVYIVLNAGAARGMRMMARFSRTTYEYLY